MANPYRGEVKITLDRERTLRIDFNALVAAQEQLGGELDIANLGKGGFRTIRAVLWAGLVSEDPTLTIEQVGAMAGPADLHRIALAISQSMNGGAASEGESKNVQGTEVGA
jgi:hypothetical protein